MKYTNIAVIAAAGLLLSGAAFAQVANQEPAVGANSTIGLNGESAASAEGVATTQGTGGKSDDSLAAPTGNISGSQTGAANLNGPNRDGQPVRPSLKSGDAPN